MIEIFEAVMVICFGLSWPLAILKSLKSKTSKGKSIIFMIFINAGYLSGIAGKIIGACTYDKPITYVLIFYILNFIMVSIDICLFFRNRKLDKLRCSDN